MFFDRVAELGEFFDGDRSEAEFVFEVLVDEELDFGVCLELAFVEDFYLLG